MSGSDSALPAAGALRAVLAAIGSALQNRQSIVLALVVECEGSTYRKPGALIAIDAQGRQCGTLSGGCLEPELAQQAAQARADAAPRVCSFDTRSDDDALFGSGSGCRGRMQVLLLPLDAHRDEALLRAFVALDARETALRLAACVNGEHVGALALLTTPATLFWHVADAWQPLLAGVAGGRVRTLSIAHGARTDRIVVLDLAPPQRLLLLGAGPEAPALVRIAREIGWQVTVADHREGLLDRHRVTADALHRLRPAPTIAALGTRRIDAVVVMTHSASHDLEALRALAAHPVPHVALLGPPARRDELLGQLTASERAELAPRLQAPAGLALGGEGPEAIALSIAAGLPMRR